MTGVLLSLQDEIDTAAAAPLHDRFMKNAIAHPNRTCLIFNGKVSSYGDVLDRSADVSRGLTSAGIGSGQVVAIVAERSDSLVWAILGVLRSGAAFLVIDSGYPAKRIEELIELACPALVVFCMSSKRGRQDIHLTVPQIDLRRLYSKEGMRNTLTSCPVDGKTLAYYLFTSGSTGKPKCIANCHAPLLNFISWHEDTFGLNQNDRFSMLSGLSHDPILRDIFAPLSIGATLLIPNQSDITEVGGIREFLVEQKITVVHLTPPLGHLILSARPGSAPVTDVRFFFWGGDKLRTELLGAMRKIAPQAEHINFYGSTETPQAAAYYHCNNSETHDGVVPVGKGISGFQLIVVDQRHSVVEKGTVGEIAVASTFLSLGYIEGGKLRDHSDQIKSSQGLRIYYTGDFGKELHDGNVMVEGRSDDQIKIRGYRVDLNEVTSHLSTHPLVSSVVTLNCRTEDNPRIGAFVVPANGAKLSADDLRTFVERSLPSYMMPSEFAFYPGGFLLLPNGKINRKGLLEEAMKGRREPQAVRVTDLNDAVLARLVKEWQEVFPHEDIDRNSTFNGLGGDSLTYVDAYLVTEGIIGKVADDWQEIPLAELAKAVHAKNRNTALIDSVIVIRAFCICTLVAFHFYLSKLGDGATAALFVVSGYMFGRSKKGILFDAKRSRELLQPAKHLLFPTMIFVALGTLYDFLKHGVFVASGLLMVLDLYSGPKRSLGEDIIYFWYLEALIKIIVCAYLIQKAASGFAVLRKNPLLFVALATSVLCAFRLAFMYALHLYARSYTHVVGTYSFLACIGFFYLGILLDQIKTTRDKIVTCIAILVYCVPTEMVFGLRLSVYLMLTTLMIVFVPRLAIPSLLRRPIYEIASATLYIYLVHLWVLRVATDSGVMHEIDTHNFAVSFQGVALLIAGIGSGIVVARLIKVAQAHSVGVRQTVENGTRRKSPRLGLFLRALASRWSH